jgi:hypothetical protein
MKKLVSLLCLFSSSFMASGQAVDYLDLPVVGELWIEFKDTVGSNFSITPGGAGQNWNYLTSFSVHDTIQYLPQMTSSIPSAISNLFPTATSVAAGETAGDYTFYKIDLTGMYIDGLYSATGFDVAGNLVNDKNYSNDLLLIPVPFDTGYVIQNTSNYNYIYPDPSLTPDALVRVTYSTFQDLEADAQGSLTTPLGNYSNVIRIKEMLTSNILYELDSFALGNFTYLTDFPSPTTYAYKWLKQGPNCLVMTAELDEFQNVTSASYFTSSGLVSDEQNSKFNTSKIFPSPVQQGYDVTMLIDENFLTTVVIYDLAGREVFQTTVQKGINKLKLSTLLFEPGMYYAHQIKENQKTEIVKFSVIK